MTFSGSIRRPHIPENFVNFVKPIQTLNGDVFSVKHACAIDVNKFT